jgi:hypothetical protein
MTSDLAREPAPRIEPIYDQSTDEELTRDKDIVKMAGVES